MKILKNRKAIKKTKPAKKLPLVKGSPVVTNTGLDVKKHENKPGMDADAASG